MGREIVANAVGESSGIATAMLSYAEFRAAFARLLREQSLTPDEHANVVSALDERWTSYEKPAVTWELVRLAGNFAQRYALRGYDSVQLASAYVCDDEEEDLRFPAFDDDLNKAVEQLMTLYGREDTQ